VRIVIKWSVVYKMVNCPHCKMEIESLNFSVVAVCSGNISIDDIKKGNMDLYDSDDLMRSGEFDDFGCDECGEILFNTEEEAREFLTNGK